ncbi:MAG: BMP family ABC transporter substrate-binding protein [Bifidobacteriaceae bacterium]|jgi:basic membrane protein A|nr:BMP family ABC transporter substrate-binding protein [Bifidobacteriaceae bacterium]
MTHHRTIKRNVALAAGLALAVALGATACADPKDATGQESAEPSRDQTVVAPLSGQLGDKSFFDSANRGFERARADLGLNVQVIEASTNDAPAWERNLRDTAKRKDVGLIVTGGTVVASTLAALAPDYPEAKFVIFDAASQGDNVTGITYAQNEGAFIAGVTAAVITLNPDQFPRAQGTKRVGMIGGTDIPVGRDFAAGFEDGVKAVDPSIEVDLRFTGDFVNPQKGYDTASAMVKDGADVVYHFAGPAGLGILQAVDDANGYAIGQDSDQNDLYPDTIVGSAIKSVDETLFAAIRDWTEGKLEMGQTRVGNLANNGVGFVFNDALVPGEAKASIGEWVDRVKDGSVKPASVL